ncbi:MAG: hypothetical protein HYW48_05375, partial [Deltaproteobacteria bacterium]|nr:hypothetical protein [Deltaproteobacteria bacterium]
WDDGGEDLLQAVIPRLDRGVRLVRGRLPRWIPRSSRGMTVERTFYKLSSRGLTAGSDLFEEGCPVGSRGQAAG